MTAPIQPTPIDLLPVGPRPIDTEEQFNAKSFATIEAQEAMIPQLNAAIAAAYQNAVVAYEAALAASESKDQAAAAALNAFNEAARSHIEANRSEAAAASAWAAAAAAGSEAGLPSLVGKAGMSLTVNAAGNGVEWKAAGFEIGGIYTGSKKPSLGTWLDTDAVYLQASYPALFAALGLIASLPVWTSRFTPGGGSYAFASNGNRAVIAAAISSPNIFHTSDGINWVPTTGTSGSSVASSTINGSFVSVGVNSRVYSPDGISWAAQSVGSVTYRAVTFGNERYITFSQLGAAIYSPTGEIWTNGPTISGLGAAVSMVFADTQHVGVGANICFTTINGEAWVSRAIPAGAYTKVAQGNGITLALGASACAISYDSGSSWRPGIAPVATVVSALTFFAGVFYAATTGGLFMTTDGLSWIRLPLADGAAVGALGAFKGLLLWGGASVYTAPLHGYNTATQFLTPTWQRGPGVNSWIKAGD